MRKTKTAGACILSAMSLYCMDASLFAKEQMFLINGAQIQESYHEQANLSFLVDDDKKDKAQLFVKSSNLDMKEIKTITWQKVENGWIGQVEVLDGDDVQYELKIDKESFLTPAFDKDTTPYSIKFYEDKQECGALQDTYSTHPLITFQFFDQHQKQVITSVKKDGVEQTISWLKQQEEFQLQLENGSYQFHFEMEDAYGNQAVYDKEILVDDTLPQVTLMKDGVKWEPQVMEQDGTFRLYVVDEHLDIAASKIYINDVLQEVAWESDENGQYMTFSIMGENEHVLRYEIVDNCGNMVKDQVELSIDQSAPILHLFEGKEEITNLQPIYDHALQLRFQIDEPHLNYEESSIEIDDKKQFLNEPREAYTVSLSDGSHHIRYYFVDQVHHVCEQDLGKVLIDQMAPVIDMKIDKYQKNNVTFPITITEEHIDQYWAFMKKDGKEKELVLNWTQKGNQYFAYPKFEQEGVYEIEVGASDLASNRTIKKVDFVIDHNAPTVSYTYDDHEHTKYLNHARMLCWNVSDLYLDEENSIIQIMRDGKVIDELHPKDNKQDTLRYQIKKDGVYDINWKIFDLSGNQTSGSDHFIIDQKAPKLSLQALSAPITNQHPLIQYAVSDDYLSDYTLSITRNSQTKTYEGTQAICEQLSLMEQGYGEYDIRLSAKDLAGNITTTDSLHLIYDPIAPNINTTINHQPFHNALPYITNKDVQIQSSISDLWLNQVIATLYEDDQFFKQLQGNEVQLYIGKEDGKKHQYKLVIDASDLAGNLTSRQYDFVIDNYKPNIHFENEKDAIYHAPYTPAIKDDQKKLSVVHWTLKRNGEVQPYLWNQPIKEEGDYELEVDVRDQAMNRWKLPPYHFTIDEQAPIISLYDVDHAYQILDHGMIHSQISLYIDQKDSHKRSHEYFTKIMIDGKEIDVNQIKYDENGYAYYLIMLEHETHIYAKAEDEAGNVTEFDQIITPLEEAQVKEEIKTAKQQDSIQMSEQLEENESKSDIMIYSLTGILFVITGTIWYGLRKRRNHHS